MPVAVHGVTGSMDVISMDWFSGTAPLNRPVLAICYKSGIMLLMKNCIEEGTMACKMYEPDRKQRKPYFSR